MHFREQGPHILTRLGYLRPGADPNAPSGAHTTAPSFHGLRSLAFVFCRFFASSLQVLCIAFRIGRARRSANSCPKFMPKSTKTEAIIYEQSINMCPGALRAAFGASVGSKNATRERPLNRFYIFFRNYCDLVAILAQLGSRGVPKS